MTQTNSSAAKATGGNANVVAQTADQTQTGGGQNGGQEQGAAQSAPTSQQAGARAASTQVNPLNMNIVVRNKSPGDEGPVSQTNTSLAGADASNANAVMLRVVFRQSLSFGIPKTFHLQGVGRGDGHMMALGNQPA